MTAQITERLRYLGHTRDMCTEPLESFIEAAEGVDSGGEPRSPFRDTGVCSALWRGYIGSWVICGGRLYLVRLSRPRWDSDGDSVLRGSKRLDMGLLFPGHRKRVFAHWYTGTLKVRDGKMLAYKHMGYFSVFERELLIDVEHGLVTGTRIRDNRAGADTSTKGSDS